jgi:O-antigen/teichoic acid export membrane protein
MLKKLTSLSTKLSLNRNYANALITGYGLMGITIAVQLLLIPLYLTYLGREKFGVLVMIMAANNYAAIGVGWLTGGMARILAERSALDDVEGFRVCYAFAKWLHLGYSVFILLIFWSISPWVLESSYNDPEIFFAVILSSFYFILVYEYSTDRIAFDARKLQSKGNLREVAGQLIFACCVLMGLHAGWGLPGVVGAQIAGVVVNRLLAWHFWQQDSYQVKWTMSNNAFHGLWRRISGKMGRDYIIFGVLMLTLQADVLLLGWLAGPETAAIYYILWRIPEIFILLIARIPSSYGPFLIAMETRGERDSLIKNYRRGLYLMMGLAGSAALVYGAVGSYILELWVGPIAPQELLPFVVSAGAMFFLAIARWPINIAYSLLNTTPLIKILALEAILKILIATLFFSKFDFLSPIVATILVHAFGLSFLYFRLGQKSIQL